MNTQPPTRNMSSGLQRLRSSLENVKTLTASGRVLSARGTLVVVELPGARVGDLCDLKAIDTNETMLAEVVGFSGDKAFLAPYGELRGISSRLEVISRGHGPSIFVGDYILGCVVDASGNLMRGRPPDRDTPGEWREIEQDAPAPLDRPGVVEPFATGLRVIDGMLTMGKGQRMGIFGTAGGGKSTLVAEIVKGSEADVIVVGLIGERGREVGDFLRHAVPGETGRKTVVVAATSDRPSVERMQASMTATTIAEYFRDRGKRVMLIIDSVTRLARAMREIGLAAGEPPTRRGFPPSVFAQLPRLFERAGNTQYGSMTAIYTVLVEGDPDLDPIAEEVRGLLDGHIILSPDLARSGHYPAIDILTSKSRLMDSVTGPKHREAASRIRQLMSSYKDIELLVRVGEYTKGSDKVADEAIDKIDDINAFLKQKPDEHSAFPETIERLLQLAESS
jgi:type III secretion protein N (ATPase)